MAVTGPMGLTLIESNNGFLYWGLMPTLMAEAVCEAYGRRMHPIIFCPAEREDFVKARANEVLH